MADNKIIMAETKCKYQCEAEERKVEQESFAMTMLKTYANTLKKVIAVLVIVIMCWLATIGGFVWYLNQYDYSTTEYSQDGNGINQIAGGNINGADLKDNNEDT